MLDELRKPFLIIALVLIFVVILIEGGSSLLVDFGASSTSASGAKPPGYGIAYLAFLDTLVFYTILLQALTLIIPKPLQARLQGCATVIVSFLGCLGAIFAIFTCLIVLIIMVTLLLAPIFGTLAYLAIYGDFERGVAAGILSFIMALKIAFVVCLLLAQQNYLKIPSLVLMLVTSLLANIIISFLHNFVPGILVSITDAIGAIIVAILAVIWAIFLFIGGLTSVIKAILDRRSVA